MMKRLLNNSSKLSTLAIKEKGNKNINIDIQIMKHRNINVY